MEHEKKQPDHSDETLESLILRQIQSGGSLTDPVIRRKLQSITETSATSGSAQQDLQKKCLLMLHALPKQEIGINDKRVKNFLEKNNLRHCEYFVLNTNDIPKEIRAIMNPDSKVRGMYISELDVVILLADRIRETSDSIVNKESLLVHELAHSSARENSFGVPGDSSHEKVQGGAFFEEGFVDLLASEYFAEYGNLHDTWAKTSGEHVTMNSVFPVNQIDTTDGQRIYIDAKRTTSPSGSKHAGFGLELLCHAIPSLKKQLVKGRKDPKAFTAALARIDRHFPGLSKNLMSLHYNVGHFEAGYKLIMQSIYGTHEIVTNNRNEPVVPNVTGFRYRIGKLLG